MSLRLLLMCSCLIVGLTGAWGQPARGSLAKVLGVNHYDLLMQYLGNASAANGSASAQVVTRAMGQKAIKDASFYSFAFLRVAVSGYGPSNSSQTTSPAGANSLALWQSNPTAYWQIVDEMFSDLDANGMGMVAVLNFNWTQFPALAGDTLTDLITNPSSASRNLLKSYIAQFINRYKLRRTITFYELTNELNLGADLDLVGSCNSSSGGAAAQCTNIGNFSSAQLLQYTYEMVSYIKSLDPTRAISSGYALQRPSALHLAGQPQWSLRGPDWTSDTQSEFIAFLQQMNRPFDIVSAHIYPGDIRFGRLPGTEWQTLDDVVSAAYAIGKRVYLGEFGDDVTKGITSYLTTMLEEISRRNVFAASPWILEWYQFSTYQSANLGSSFPNSLEPGYADTLLRNYGSAAGNDFYPPPISSTPTIVMTWPFPCSAQRRSVSAYAVASAPNGIEWVDFAVDGVVAARVSTPPYSAVIALQSTGLKILTATAYTTMGVSATFTTPIQANGSTAPCTLPQIASQRNSRQQLLDKATEKDLLHGLLN